MQPRDLEVFSWSVGFNKTCKSCAIDQFYPSVFCNAFTRLDNRYSSIAGELVDYLAQSRHCKEMECHNTMTQTDQLQNSIST